MDRYLTATEVKKIYTLGLSSLKYWESRGILRPLKTPGGHRRYSEQEIQSMLGLNKVLPGKRCAVYARPLPKNKQIAAAWTDNLSVC